MSRETPRYATKQKRIAWQPFVDSQIRRQVRRGIDQDVAVEHALDMRDEHIKRGDQPPKYGRRDKK